MQHPFPDSLQDFTLTSGARGRFCSLPALEQAGIARVSRLPVSIRIVLESVLRHCDDDKITASHVRELANWQPRAPRNAEIPFVVARILLQDFTGVPLLVDLAAMRSAVQRHGADPKIVEPRVPVDLVVDHSVQVDHYNSADALDLNMKLEFRRNAERYRFIKWGMQAFRRFRAVPPGIGIVHQVNLESLARGVWQEDGIYYPDTLVGTDSHTTMINGLGVVGWGVGGIEAEAGMLGQPLYFLTPDVVGVQLDGRLAEGVTATDLVLAVTERLRRADVVGKFVEFHGAGAASLTVPDRATLANMAPEYGATMGFFPPDEATAAYLAATGRSAAEVDAFRSYWQAQQMFGTPAAGAIDYSEVIAFDLGQVRPSVAGPKRPQDRIDLGAMKQGFAAAYGLARTGGEIDHGSVLIAAITSCTNTSNPSVMLAAGLLAQKAVARGLAVKPQVKTSLAPGSRVVTAYLQKAGLLPYLEQLGFGVVAYGCTTCIGNAGPLAPEIEAAIAARKLVCAAVLSGNRNFEARIHPSLKANYLMSPPLVVAFAIAGRVDIDLDREPLGNGKDGEPVYLRDIWPKSDEIAAAMRHAIAPQAYADLYRDAARGHPLWNDIAAPGGATYAWEASTYIAEPPFFAAFALTPAARGDVRNARALAVFGDSVTTDHISPAGSIAPTAPAGIYLQQHGVVPADFNSYGARRGHHEVMMRGTFANVRIANLLLPPCADGTRIEGGYALLQPEGETLPLYDAAMRYLARGTPTVIFAGTEYGTGSSRDWAAKGTRLLGVKAVVARSFERIHRSNLVCMGVLPLQFHAGDGVAALDLRGDEEFDILGLDAGIRPQQEVRLVVRRANGRRQELGVLLRIDTPIEADYYRHDGILPYVLRELLASDAAPGSGSAEGPSRREFKASR
ncbi:MAG: aconitate hydratase AcnA [Rhodocyclales bacterium]|nr:aconitate hydratase AcnA [Rhodocyclales bacterium]